MAPRSILRAAAPAFARMKAWRSGTARRTAQVLEKTRPGTKKPQLFRVILHNDDYTTMEFVIEVLEAIFNKSPAEAFRIMMHVHTRGHGVCGAYPLRGGGDQGRRWSTTGARAQGFPLRASMEEE